MSWKKQKRFFLSLTERNQPSLSPQGVSLEAPILISLFESFYVSS